MNLRAAVLVSTVAAGVLVGCSGQDRQKADHADAKAKAQAQKFAAEARQEAHKLSAEIGKGMNGPVSPSGEEAKRKLRDAGRTVDHSALIAGVKTKLATDVGLSTMSTVRVDVSGSVVTLSGTTVTEDQKRAAEQSASQVPGVSRIINNIVVQR